MARHLGGTVSDGGVVSGLSRRFRVGVFPIGIDTRRFADLAVSREARALSDRLGRCFRDRAGLIGVDRLDYTKGLEYRLRAFERVVETAPPGPQMPFLLQIAAPSREAIPEYAALKGDLESLSGRINVRHGRIGWTPVQLINRTFSQARLAALYRLSRVGVVSPLRDGMNLVAMEYVASQNPDDPGVLVLSRFAGAAERLGGAVLVNPYDIDGMAAAMQRALDMSLEERSERWSSMIGGLRDYDVHRWRDDFLRALCDAHRRPYPSSAPAAVAAAAKARRRQAGKALSAKTQARQRDPDAPAAPSTSHAAVSRTCGHFQRSPDGCG